jgi:condensin-2 complex subunit D3
VLALLSELPNPLGLDKEAYYVNENSDVRKEAAPMGGENSVMLDDAKGLEESIPSPGSTSIETQTWWGVACLEALLHRCSDKVPSIRARALHNLAEALELLSSDIRNRAMLQNLLGLRVLSQARRDTEELIVERSALLSSLDTPCVKSPSLGGQTPSPEPSIVGPGASPLTPGSGHGDLGSLLRRRCVDDKVAVRKSALFLMTKSASLLGRPPDEAMLKAMGNACSDLMLSIRKAALAALSEVTLSNFYTSSRPIIKQSRL